MMLNREWLPLAKAVFREYPATERDGLNQTMAEYRLSVWLGKFIEMVGHLNNYPVFVDGKFVDGDGQILAEFDGKVLLVRDQRFMVPEGFDRMEIEVI